MGFAEFGSSIGSAIGNVTSAVGRSIGSVGRGVETGPSVGPRGFSASAMETGGPGSLGPDLLGGRNLGINEGPAGVGFWETTMPYIPKFNTTGEILFNPFPKGAAELPSGPEAVAQVEGMLFQTKGTPLPEQRVPEIATEANYWPGAAYWFTDVEPKVVKPADVFMPEPKVAMEPLKKGKVLEQAEEVAAKAWDNHVLTQAENAANRAEELSPKSVPAPAEQILEEEVVEEKVEEKRQEILEEEMVVEQKAYLEDEDASAQRRHEIREALVKAKVEVGKLGLKKLAGWLVAKFLPGEHAGNRSRIVKETGPDGSYQETVEAIAGTGELESEEGAVERFNKIVAEKKPVKYGKEGTPVDQHDVQRVFKFHLFKPAQPLVEVVKRVVKKAQVAPSPTIVPVQSAEKVVKPEPSLKDFPDLAGVFQKAA